MLLYIIDFRSDIDCVSVVRDIAVGGKNVTIYR